MASSELNFEEFISQYADIPFNIFEDENAETNIDSSISFDDGTDSGGEDYSIDERDEDIKPFDDLNTFPHSDIMPITEPFMRRIAIETNFHTVVTLDKGKDNGISGDSTKEGNNQLEKQRIYLNTSSNSKKTINNKGKILKNKLEDIIKQYGGTSFADAERDIKLKEALLKEINIFAENDMKSTNKRKK